MQGSFSLFLLQGRLSPKPGLFVQFLDRRAHLADKLISWAVLMVYVGRRTGQNRRTFLENTKTHGSLPKANETELVSVQRTSHRNSNGSSWA